MVNHPRLWTHSSKRRRNLGTAVRIRDGLPLFFYSTLSVEEYILARDG